MARWPRGHLPWPTWEDRKTPRTAQRTKVAMFFSLATFTEKMIKLIIIFSGRIPPLSEGVQQERFANHLCKFSENLGYLGHLG